MIEYTLLLFIVFAILQIADGVTTFKIIKAGGCELNPVVKYAIENIGLVQGLVIAKAISIGLGYFLLVNSQATTLLVVSCIYAAVIINNGIQYYRITNTK